MNKDQAQKKDSLIEKKKLLLFLQMSARSNSLKNYSLIGKVKREIAREMTSLNAEGKTKKF